MASVLTVKNILKRPAVAAQSDWTMGRVIELLLKEDVSTLMVVDSGRRLVGLITESPLLIAALDPQVCNDPVSLHMNRQFVSVDARASVTDAMETILLHRVRMLPVLENGIPIGMISRRDLLRQLQQSPTGNLNAILT